MVLLPRKFPMFRQTLPGNVGHNPALPQSPGMISPIRLSWPPDLPSLSASAVHPGVTGAKHLAQMRRHLLTSHVVVSGMPSCNRAKPWEMLVIPDSQRPRLPLHRTGFGDSVWPLCHLSDAGQRPRPPFTASVCTEGGAGLGSVSSADVQSGHQDG